MASAEQAQQRPGASGLPRLLRARPVAVAPRGEDKTFPQRHLFEAVGEQQGLKSGVPLEPHAEHLVRFPSCQAAPR